MQRENGKYQICLQIILIPEVLLTQVQLMDLSWQKNIFIGIDS